MDIPIGVCVGSINTQNIEFIGYSNIELGEYVYIPYENYKVLGFVRYVTRVNRSVPEDASPDDVKKSGRRSFFRGSIAVLGDYMHGMSVPRIPPEPGTSVYRAPADMLEEVFGGDKERGLCIGSLLTRDDVKVFIDIDSIMSRHLAVLAVTGAGKSNTVSVIIEGILDKAGTVVIFDMHGEYSGFRYGKNLVNLIDLKLNPQHLSYAEFRQFANIDDSAFIQDRYLRRARKAVLDLIESGRVQPSDFWGRLLAELLSYRDNPENREDRKSIVGVINKVEDAIEFFSELFDLLQRPMVNQIQPGKLNVIDLSQVDEKVADIIVSHVLRNLLSERKNFVKGESSNIEFPVFVIIEEAHILASSYISTKSKYWISRIAREGRKFGIGICLVSQRPKSLDVNALSQINNMIILKLIEPGDQRHVQQSSEMLSSELAQQLSALNTGEALVMGSMVPVPALVKIRLSKAKTKGSDISAVDEWKRTRDAVKLKKRELDEILDINNLEF